MATKEAEGIKAWPTAERFDEARRALTDAYNVLEHLAFEFDVLNGEYAADDIASESVPVTADAIAATVEFINHSEIEVAELAKFHEQIAAWPGMIAHVRSEQRNQGKAA